MCLLTFFPGGSLPDADALHNGAYLNRDGHGFAIVTRDRLIIERGLDGDQVIEDFARQRRAHRDGPALFHSRMGTHGSIDKANCHPFRVGGDPRTVLAHNGVLPKRVWPAKGDRRSDTRVAAEDYLPRHPFGSLATQRGRTKFANWLTPTNKIVLLTVDPRYRERAYLLNEDFGIWDGGVWYSNTDFRPSRDVDVEWWDYDTTCRYCLGVDSVDPETGYCVDCGFCADCGVPQSHCACYRPGVWDDPDDSLPLRCSAGRMALVDSTPSVTDLPPWV